MPASPQSLGNLDPGLIASEHQNSQTWQGRGQGEGAEAVFSQGPLGSLAVWAGTRRGGQMGLWEGAAAAPLSRDVCSPTPARIPVGEIVRPSPYPCSHRSSVSLVILDRRSVRTPPELGGIQKDMRTPTNSLGHPTGTPAGPGSLWFCGRRRNTKGRQFAQGPQTPWSSKSGGGLGGSV